MGLKREGKAVSGGVCRSSHMPVRFCDLLAIILLLSLFTILSYLVVVGKSLIKGILIMTIQTLLQSKSKHSILLVVEHLDP